MTSPISAAPVRAGHRPHGHRPLRGERRPGRRAGLLAAALLTTSMTVLSAGPAAATTPQLPLGPAGAVQRACAPAHGITATCYAELVTPAAGTVSPDAAIVGLRPADIASAYSLSAGATGVIGIVDAQDDPNAESDLAVYRAKWKLPACTTANGCFQKVNQNGAPAPLPAGDPGWGLEISLDLDAASAACPACSILLVEGRTPSLRDLGIAVNTAATLGADVVSNSYGADEFKGIAGYASRYYDHPGVPIVASSGDFGFGAASFPAVATSVIGVGGTTLNPASTSRGWTERVWSGAGSGCSAYIAKPAWQPGTHCLMRTVADVSAVADPRTGLATYDTYGTSDLTKTGWIQVGGTSLASPLIAAMLVRAGRTSAYDDASSLYARAASFNDVVGGSNGYCGGDYLCTGKPGYDAPSGVGTPAGLGAL